MENKVKEKMTKKINELENRNKFLDALIDFLNSELKLVNAALDTDIPLKIDVDIKY